MQKVNKNPISHQMDSESQLEAAQVHVEAVAHQSIDVMIGVLTHFGLIEMVKTMIIRKDAQTSEWLDSTKAAAYLDISEGQLRNKTSNGEIPFYKFNKLNRYKRSDLDALLSQDKRGRVTDGN